MVASFNQLAGINALIYYTADIFKMAGAARTSALLQSVLIGLTNLVFTMVAMTVIDRFGRRRLLLIGAVGLAACLGLTAWAFHTGVGGVLVLGSLVGYIAFFAFSQGSVIWVYISEIFPNRVRARGQALGSFTHWFWAAVVSWTFPIIAERSGASAFGFFAAMMLLQFVLVLGCSARNQGRSRSSRFSASWGSSEAPMSARAICLLVMPLAAVVVAGLATDPPAAGQEPYREPLRPRVHFTPPQNFMNDPNGLVFYKGEYHLFYQHNPFGREWGHMSWGHAVSTDMLHWKHLPIALGEEDGVMIFSGSVVVDWHNTSGLCAGRRRRSVMPRRHLHRARPRQADPEPRLQQRSGAHLDEVREQPGHRPEPRELSRPEGVLGRAVPPVGASSRCSPSSTRCACSGPRT